MTADFAPSTGTLQAMIATSCTSSEVPCYLFEEGLLPASARVILVAFPVRESVVDQHVFCSDHGDGKSCPCPRSRVLHQTFCLPAMPKDAERCLVHAKLILLFHAHCLRVVLSSADLKFGDWMRHGNTVWFQDFPLLRSSSSGSAAESKASAAAAKASDFHTQLSGFLDSFGAGLVPADLTRSLSSFDFSAADDAGVRLVRSRPEPVAEQFADAFGKDRVRAMLRRQLPAGVRFAREDRVLCMTASIGGSQRHGYECFAACVAP